MYIFLASFVFFTYQGTCIAAQTTFIDKKKDILFHLYYNKDWIENIRETKMENVSKIEEKKKDFLFHVYCNND